MLALCLCGSARAADIVSATVTLTNASNITGTNGGSITINGDTRTWTNTVHNAATQVLVSTNIASDTTRLLIQTTTYPFSGLTIPAYATNSITWRGLSGAAVAVTLSPTNWGSVSYVTNAITAATVIRVPMSVETSTNRAPLANQLLSDLDAYGTAKLWSAFTLSNSTWKGLLSPDAGLGLHGRGLVATNYTLTTNDLYVGTDTRSNTNLILTLPSATSASNLLFLIKDEGGAGATNTIKIYPQSGDRIDTLLTNLVVSNNFGGVILRSRGLTNWALIASGGGVTGGIAGSGGGVPLTNTVWVAKNGSDSGGARGDPAKAYLTLGAANTNGVAGDTIFVMPGNYDEAGIVLKDKVNWNFAPGAEVVNTTNGTPIFLDAANVACRITGAGVFTNASAGGYEVLQQASSGSDIYFECLRASGGHASDFYFTIAASAGALRVQGGTIVGWHSPAVLVSGSAAAYFDGVTLDARLNDQTSLGSALVTAATNVVTLRNCTALGSDDGSWGATTIYSVHATSARTVNLEGTLNANLPANPNVTYANVSYAGQGVENLAGKLVLAGTTNQIVFGAVNSAPADTNTIVQWISVQVSGLTNVFRLPLYQ